MLNLLLCNPPFHVPPLGLSFSLTNAYSASERARARTLGTTEFIRDIHTHPWCMCVRVCSRACLCGSWCVLRYCLSIQLMPVELTSSFSSLWIPPPSRPQMFQRPVLSYPTKHLSLMNRLSTEKKKK